MLATGSSGGWSVAYLGWFALKVLYLTLACHLLPPLNLSTWIAVSLVDFLGAFIALLA